MRYYRLTVADDGSVEMIEVSGPREVFGQPGTEQSYASVADAVASLAPAAPVQVDAPVIDPGSAA